MKKLYIGFTILLILSIGAGIYYFTGYRQSQMEFPNEVTMESTTSTDYSFKEMPQKIRLLEFMYTNCPDVCPNTTYQMVDIRDRLVKDGLFGDKVEFLTVTIDPARDTVPIMKEYGETFKTTAADGWYVLRGDAEDTRKLADAFRFQYKDPGSGFLIHTNATYLINEKNRIIEVFGMGDKDFDREEVYKKIVKNAEKM